MTYEEIIEIIEEFNNDGYIVSEQVANKYHLSTEHITDEMSFDGILQELRELEEDIYEISIYKIFEKGGMKKTRIVLVTEASIFIYYLDGKFYSGGIEVNEKEAFYNKNGIGGTIEEVKIETIHTFIK